MYEEPRRLAGLSCNFPGPIRANDDKSEEFGFQQTVHGQHASDAKDVRFIELCIRRGPMIRNIFARLPQIPEAS